MQNTLRKIGLNPEEIELYLYLIEKGAQTASQIGSNTTVKRTYVYKIAADLASKGLIIEEKRGKATVFKPEPPEKLQLLVENKRTEIESAGRELKLNLSSLMSKYSSMEAKPVVTYYEGVEGIKKAYLKTLEAKGDILALVGVTKPNPEVWKWLREVYIHKRIEAGVRAQVIVPKGEKQEEYTKVDDAELRVTKVVPAQVAPIEHEINIFNDTIAILNAKEGETPLGIFIENPVIANSFRAWFQLTWDRT